MSNRHPTDLEQIRGVNYLPSTSVNPTQMWSGFESATIDRELGFAERIGLNAIRVFLQYLVYENDAIGLLDRFDELLRRADGHGLSVLPYIAVLSQPPAEPQSRLRSLGWVSGSRPSGGSWVRLWPQYDHANGGRYPSERCASPALSSNVGARLTAVDGRWLASADTADGPSTARIARWSMT
jgi:hypothetical protein